MLRVVCVFKLVVEDIDGEPRVADVLLGEALGYSRERGIRDLIDRHSISLRELGKLPHRTAVSGSNDKQKDALIWIKSPIGNVTNPLL